MFWILRQGLAGEAVIDLKNQLNHWNYQMFLENENGPQIKKMEILMLL